MIEEFGYVVSLKSDEVAVVTCVKTGACKGCASEKMCSLGRDDGKRLVEVHNQLHAQPGNRVKIATTNRAFYKSSFLVYILPLILLLIGAGLGQWLGTSVLTGVDPNLSALILGVLFLAATFVGIHYWNRHLPKEEYMPTIVDIIPQDEAMPCGELRENLSHGH
ncbi:MAG: SoxR reducing system RseC family protein [Deltaproteobacteria bacterium]|nr:SoxR reducing system RseC family protein [Deltaproteobacteria bacterium]